MVCAALEGKCIVYLALFDYDRNPQRSQHLASRFAQQNRVLYVESSFSIVGLIRNGPREFRKIVRYWRGVQKRGDSLFLWTPPPSLYPLERIPWISKAYALYVGRLLRQQIEKLHWEASPVLVSALPWGAMLGKQLGAQLTVLDWYRPWIQHWAHIILKGRFWKPFIEWNYRAKERMARDAVARADLVFCGAWLYYNKATEWGAHPVHLPNGAEMAMWDASKGETSNLPVEIRSTQGPWIGLIAARIHPDIVDIELIAAVARQRPEWDWVIIGEPHSGLNSIRKCSNVHLLGHKPYMMLPEYVAGFDVCAIPYRQSSTTQSGIPVKLLEYLPSGKPIISYASSEIEGDPELCSTIRFAATADEFIHAVETAISHPEDEEVLRKRQEVAQRYDWDYLATYAMETIERELSQKLSTMLAPALNGPERREE